MSSDSREVTNTSLPSDSSAITQLPLDVFQSADILLKLQSGVFNKKRKMSDQSENPKTLTNPENDKMIVDDTSTSDYCDKNQTRNASSEKIINRQQPPNGFRYDESLKGECKIMIESSLPNTPAKDFNRLTYAKILNSKYKNCIVDVKSSGFGKLAVFTKSACAANIILDDKSLESKGLKAFIPSYFVTSQGVIRNIPLDISEKEIKENLEILGYHHNNSAVINVRRLSRKTINNETKKAEYVPSNTVLLTFNNKSLPSKVSIFNASLNVEKYTPPVKACWKCLRYGHISKYCKSEKKCRKCGESAHEENVTCPLDDKDPVCVHCSGPHLPHSSDCPEFNFQKDFRAYAVNHSLTFVEAKAVLRPKKSKKTLQNSSSAPLVDFNFSNFPELGECSSTLAPTVSPSQTSYSERITSFPIKSSHPAMTKQTFSNTKQNLPSHKNTKNNTKFSHLYATRLPSSLPNGFALHPHEGRKNSTNILFSGSQLQSLNDNSLQSVSLSPSSKNLSSENLTAAKIINNLMTNLSKLLNFSTDFSPNTEEFILLKNISAEFTSLLNSFSKPNNGQSE